MHSAVFCAFMPIALALLLLVGAPDDVEKLAQTVQRNAKLPYEQREREKAIRSLGRIGSPAGTKVLIGLLDDAFAHQQDGAVSALIALKRRSPAERAASLTVLTKALTSSRNPTVRRHLATALGRIGDPRGVDALAAALAREKDERAARAQAVALGRIGGPEAIAALEKVAAGKSVARADAVRALGPANGRIEFVIRFAKDPHDAVRAAVVDALRTLGSESIPCDDPGELQGIALADSIGRLPNVALAAELARDLLSHDSWRVRAAGIQGVEARKDAALLPLLVTCMDRERGRLRHDAWRALRRLTGKDLPLDVAQWKALGELRIAQDPAPDDGAGPKETKSAVYFGLPVVSDRIAFVFDVSGSMRDDGKMELARKSFAETAASLGPDQRYDLFVYRYLLDYPPRPRLERAFGKLVAGKTKKAQRWLNKQAAKGGGAIYDALMAALEDPDVDTLYLLSDGVPSYGTIKRDFRVLQEVRAKNRWRRVVIHTILLGSRGTDRKFMRALARDNGGVAMGSDGRPLR